MAGPTSSPTHLHWHRFTGCRVQIAPSLGSISISERVQAKTIRSFNIRGADRPPLAILPPFPLSRRVWLCADRLQAKGREGKKKHLQLHAAKKHSSMVPAQGPRVERRGRREILAQDFHPPGSVSISVPFTHTRMCCLGHMKREFHSVAHICTACSFRRRPCSPCHPWPQSPLTATNRARLLLNAPPTPRSLLLS